MNNNSISFIVIGRNEGWKITKCLESIFLAIGENGIVDYEIIYVDSKSKDDTLARVKKFDNVLIFLVTGKRNAAIARNIGASEAQKNFFFFIDGDMEIIPETLDLIYKTNSGLVHDFVSGDFEDVFYDRMGNCIDSSKRHKLKNDTFQVTTGGLFIITQKLWLKIGGMRNKFRIGEDLDLGIRLSKQGYKLFRKREVLAKHHTVSYNSNDRFWRDVFNGDFLFYKPLLYRSNFFNRNMYRLLLREITMFFLIVFIFLAIYFNSLYFLGLYLLLVFTKLIYKRNMVKGPFWSLLIRYIIFDLGTLLGFVFFWPSSPKNITYIKI